MGLSLKQKEMVEFLEAAKQGNESFITMLWGTIIAELPLIEGRTAVSAIMQFMPVGGVAAMPNNAFCYIGVSDRSLYAIALDAYNTSKIIGTFVVPFNRMSALQVRKTMLGSYVVDAICEDGSVNLTVKNTSLGTDIKDQKQRVEAFITEIQRIKDTLRI